MNSLASLGRKSKLDVTNSKMGIQAGGFPLTVLLLSGGFQGLYSHPQECHQLGFTFQTPLAGGLVSEKENCQGAVFF